MGAVEGTCNDMIRPPSWIGGEEGRGDKRVREAEERERRWWEREKGEQASV